MGNPNHDPKTGEFSEGSGGSMGSSAHASGKLTGDKTSDAALNGKMIEAQNKLRSEYQNLHYQRIAMEKRAREFKKSGDKVNESAAWAMATQISQKEHSVEGQYKSFNKQMRSFGLKP